MKMNKLNIKEIKSFEEKLETKLKLINKEQEEIKKLKSDFKTLVNELEAPTKAEARQAKIKARAEETKRTKQEDRNSYLNLVIKYNNTDHEVSVKKGSTTGKLRNKLVERLNLKGKQRLIMDFNGTDLYISNNGKSYGLKRLNTLGLKKRGYHQTLIAGRQDHCRRQDRCGRQDHCRGR